MKRIIALVLATALCLIALVSCGGETVNDTTLADVSSMYANSNPTEIVAVTTQNFGDTKLVSTKKLSIGTVTDASGTSKAAIYDNSEAQMRNVTEGGQTDEILETIKNDRVITLYVEGKGTKNIDVKTLKATGAWNKNGTLDVPERGGIAIFLDPAVIKEFTYEDGVLSFVVPAANTLSVIGMQIDSDVTVSIANEGAVITGITLNYDSAADDEKGIAAGKVEIVVTYSYNNVKIDF